MAQWANFPWEEAMFTNADEAILRRRVAVAENLYGNRAGGWSRFPGLRPWMALPGQGRITLKWWRGDLVAVGQAGQVWRIGRNGQGQNVTGIPLSGGGRPTFAATDESLVIAAGGPIVALDSGATRLLSADAPNSTHVVWIDGYLVAIEPYSGRFRHSPPGDYGVWEDLSVFTAEGKPDDLVAAAVTPFNELLLAGPESIEQYETLASGDRPFFRRWMTGDGLAHPYTLVTDKMGTFGVNQSAEFVRFQAQVTRTQSDDIALTLQNIDDWTDAWADSVSIKGQRFIILQAPNASAPDYDARGITLLLDMNRGRWSFLWGYDRTSGGYARWPGWSLEEAWGRVFVGVQDGIAELDPTYYENLADPMRCLIRSAHVDEFGPSRLDDVRVRLRMAGNDFAFTLSEGGIRRITEDGFVRVTEDGRPRVIGDQLQGGQTARFGVRMRRDNDLWTRWVWKSMGLPATEPMVEKFGGMGCAQTWQMEISCADPVPFEFVRAQILVQRIGH